MKTGLALAGLFCSGLMLSSALAEEAAVLSAEGYANIKIGIAPDQLERHLRQKLGYNPYLNHGCSVVTTPQMAPMGLSFVIDHKQLVRINVDYYGTDPRSLTTKTAVGIGLGSTEEDILKAYGAAAVVKPNPGDPTWHTILVETDDHHNGLVFETNGKTVKSMRSGTFPFVNDPVACP